MLSIKDRRIIIVESIKNELSLKAVKAENRKHAESMARHFENSQRLKESRKIAMMQFEEKSRAALQARSKDVEARQAFLKKSLHIL